MDKVTIGVAVVTGAVASATAIAQAVIPADGSLEKLGVVTVIAGAAVYSTRYLAAQKAAADAVVEAKDRAIATMHVQQVAAARETADKLVAVIREGHDVKAQMTGALNDVRITMTGVQALLGDVSKRMEQAGRRERP